MSTIRPNRPSPFKDPANQLDVESGIQSYSSYERRLFERARNIWVRKAAMGSSVSMILFLIVGVSFFRAVTKWTWPQSLLFAISTATSVGYGHIDTPRTTHFQLFLSLYILVGFALLAIVAAQLYQFFALDDERHEPEKRQVGRSSSPSNHTKFIPKHSEIFGLWEGEIKRTFRKTHNERALSIGFPLFIVFFIGTMAIGDAERWNFHEALYFAMVSSTSVGYGDFTPKTTTGILLTCLWLPCSIVFMSICMGTIAKWYLKDITYRSSRLSLDSYAGRAGKALGPHVLPTSLLVAGALLIGQQEEWTFLESVYFAVVSSCTVGYGDFHPRTVMGMIMTIVWLPCSILSISVYMSVLARLFLRLSSQIIEELDGFIRRRNTRIISLFGGTLIVALPLLITLLTGALLVGHTERWSFLESIYFALVSSFTIGKVDGVSNTVPRAFYCTYLSFLFQDMEITTR